MQPSCPRAGKGGVSLLLLLGGASPSAPPTALPQDLVCIQPRGFGGGPVLIGHRQARLSPLLRLLLRWLQARAPLPKLHSHWPSRGTWAPHLSPGPQCSPDGARPPVPPRCWCLTLSQALWIPAMRTWTALAAHSGSSGSCTTSTAAPRPPIMLLILCGNRARIPGPCAYSYKSAWCCLAAGRGVSREPREMGVCSRPRGRGPRPEWERPPRPAGADCSAQTAASAGALAGVQDTEEEALVTF